jgi:hypothetical protein
MAKRGGATTASLRNNKLIWVSIIVLVVIVFVGALNYLKAFYQTETYYILNQDVPARTLILPDMLSPVTTSAGTAPIAALGIAEVQANDAYAQYPLLQGDILTGSNVGGLSDVAVGIPDNWVITNFSIDADSAASGRIVRGTYFDIMMIGGEGAEVAGTGGVHYPFINVLALDVTTSISALSSSQAADSEEARVGQTDLYSVGATPADAARLQSAIAQGGTMKLVLSPRQNEYNPPRVGDYQAAGTGGIFRYSVGDVPTNLGEGTDYTFTDLERDNFGRPFEVTEDECLVGNSKVPTEECVAAGGYGEAGTPTAPEGETSPEVSPEAVTPDPESTSNE